MNAMDSDAELLEEDGYSWTFDRRRCSKGQIFRHVDGSIKIWKRFALLPNINLQKYTLGNGFTSEELQGELIFWRGGEYERDNSMCEILVRDNRFWITPLEKNKIQINGIRIEAETEIRFGDFLILGKMGSESDSGARYPNVLLFAKRELNPEMFLKTLTEEEVSNLDEEDQHGVPLPIIPRGTPAPHQEQEADDSKYTLVLCKTLAYLPIPTVKQLRLLSKLVNEAAMTVLGDKCQANFQLNNPWGKSRLGRWDQANDAMAFFRYKWEMLTSTSTNPLSRCTISLPVLNTDDEEEGEHLDCSDGTSGAKLVSDLTRFFLEGHGLHITRLHLKGDIFSETDFRVRYNILKALQSTLKVLTLYGDWVVEEDSQLIPFPGDIHFKSLKHFSFALSTNGSKGEAHFSLWIESMMRPSPPDNPSERCSVINEIESLDIWLPQDNNTTVTPIFLNALNSNSSFPNLVEITLQYTTPLEMRLLRGIRQPLKKLDLNLVTDFKSRNDIEDFKGLLDKHAGTLESLEFILPRFNDFHNDEIRIPLPILPKLKALMVGLVTGDGKGEEKSTRVVLTFDLKDKIDYGLHLPKLQTLALKATQYFGDMYETEEELARKRKSIRAFWMEYASFFNSFFPPPRTPHPNGGGGDLIVKSLQVLSIPFQDRDNALFSRAPEIASMFPNVCNQWANQGEVTRPLNLLTLEQLRDEVQRLRDEMRRLAIRDRN